MRQKLIKLAVCALAVYFLFLWGSALRHDISITPSNISEKLSWELGGISAVRRVGKDIWEMSAEKVIRETPIEHLGGIASKITGAVGLRTVNAPNGEYNADEKTLLMTQAYGIWLRADHPLDWRSPKVLWQQNGDTWNFPNGITVDSDVYNFDCDQAVMKDQKEIHAVNGRVWWWSE